MAMELKWSIGWLEGFKSRNNIRKRKQHGKAALVKDLIKHIVELYAGPNRDAETDKEAIKQPQIKLNKALIAL